MDAASQSQHPLHSHILFSSRDVDSTAPPYPLSDPRPPSLTASQDGQLRLPTSLPASFTMNSGASSSWHSAPSWNPAGHVSVNQLEAQDHDRDSPMPDAPAYNPEPAHLPHPPDYAPTLASQYSQPVITRRDHVRVASAGSSIDSAASPVEDLPPTDGHVSSYPLPREDDPDNNMPDAPTDEAFVEDEGSLESPANSQAAAQPPLPPADAHSQHSVPPAEFEPPWAPIHEDTSYAEEDELKRLDTAGEISALDHGYWAKKAFKDLDDPEYNTIDTGRIEWTIEKYNGTKENPNRELVMRSEPVKIGGYDWKIKFYPKGNGTSYMGAYLECVDFVPNPHGAAGNHQDQATTPLPVLGGDNKLRRPRRVPVQLLIIAYNPQEPRVHSFKRASHGFTEKDPDRGFHRFGPVPFYDLGRRLGDARQALLRNDRLALIAHVRVLQDPTGFLFSQDEPNSCVNFLRTGLRPLRATEDRRGPATNLSAAVTSWLLHPTFRQLVYKAASSENIKPKPLFFALERVLFEMRRPVQQLPSSASVTSSFQVSLDDVADVIRWWGPGRGRETWRDWNRHRPSAQEPRHRALKPPNYETRLVWHPINDPLHDCDVIQTFEVLLDQLEEELKDTTLEGQTQAIFGRNGFRVKLTPRCKSISAGLQGGQKTLIDRQRPQLLQVEIQRQEFEQKARKWMKLDEDVVIDEILKTDQEEYNLYGIILHEWGLNSRQYTPVLRPDGQTWHKFVADRMAKVERLTRKQAILSSKPTVQIAIYTRNDVMHEAIDVSSRDFKGFPEDSYAVPEELLRKHAPNTAEDTSNISTPVPSHQQQSTETEHNPPHHDTIHESESSGEKMDAETAASPEVPQPKRVEESEARSKPHEDEIVTAENLEWDCGPPCAEEITLDYFSRPFYRGTTHKGHMHGRGHCIYMNGDIYTGTFRKGLRHGRGNQAYQNGDTYDGEWSDDKPHGTGRLVSALTGNVYEGGFKEGAQYGEFVLKGTRAETMRACLVCYDNERDAVFYPCGHVCACLECAREMEECPYCHRSIAEPIRFFLT